MPRFGIAPARDALNDSFHRVGATMYDLTPFVPSCIRAPASRVLPALVILALVALVAPGHLDAVTPLAPVSEASQTGVLEVRVIHGETGEPVGGAMIRLRQIERGGVTDAQGLAVFERVPARPLSVSAEHIGFAPSVQNVEIREGERVVVKFTLTPTALHLSGIIVTATGRARGVNEVYQPTTSMSGLELQRSLSSSIPATLEGVPGFHMQYNGPGASRPSIRGLGGDRVLMLEDGGRTGDLSQTSADHGVMVEPITAQRIEVVRGPAGLLYGPSALGGVVNVIRDDIPRSRPSNVTGSFSSQVETANRGGAVGGFVVAPAGPLVFRAEGSLREMGDTRTPEGELEKTALSAMDGSLGVSWVPEWGFVGVAARRYENLYGVPGEFNGELIPGGHTGGVEIETARTTGRFRAAYLRPFLGFFDAVEMDASVVHYLHDEIEGLFGDQRRIGARFDQTSTEGRIIARHDHELHDHEGRTLRADGAFGLQLQDRALSVGGRSPGTRAGDERTWALFGYEELSLGVNRLQLGLRLDRRGVEPRRLDPLRVTTREREVVKEVAPRNFTGLSGSIAALRDVSEGWTLGVNVAHSFRAPAIEELYSDGPHLADFSFDIGTPDLAAERGTGVDIFVRGSRPNLELETAVYANRVADYIYYAQTGETVWVIRDGTEPRLTPVYEARGEDALFVGAEGRMQWEMSRGLVLDLSASYTRATRSEDSDPLPYIPPLGGRAELRYERGPWSASAGVNGAAAQNRVPRPVSIGESVENPQDPTAAFGLLNMGAGWRQSVGGRTHSVSLVARNLTDRTWRDHLSRIKDVAPQPGRNLQLTYRVFF
jgi:iron complex outermembrane recepter protein